MQLSHQGQTNRSVEQRPISPSYVYSGEHCPIVARLVESIWFASLDESNQSYKCASSVKSNSTDSFSSVIDKMTGGEFELINRNNLYEALKRLGLKDDGMI